MTLTGRFSEYKFHFSVYQYYLDRKCFTLYGAAARMVMSCVIAAVCFRYVLSGIKLSFIPHVPKALCCVVTLPCEMQ